MLDQVQRIQIRRIERDIFETNELVKRCWDNLGGRGRGGGGGRSDDSGSGSGSDSLGGTKGRADVRRRSAGSRRGSVGPLGRRSSGTGAPVREVEETEVIRRRADRQDRVPGAASNTGRRRRDRSPPPRREYEVVQPGKIYVEVDDGRPRRQDDEEVEYVEPVRSGPSRAQSRVRDRYVDVRRGSIPPRGSSRDRGRD